MAPLYSQLLYAGSGNATGFTYYSSVVPTGYVWDVRDIVATNNLIWWQQVNGIAFLARTTSSPIAGVWVPQAVGHQTYHWERRQILNAGDQIQVNVYDTSWSWRISGYQLTTP